jgi:hypothetical protein
MVPNARGKKLRIALTSIPMINAITREVAVTPWPSNIPAGTMGYLAPFYSQATKRKSKISPMTIGAMTCADFQGKAVPPNWRRTRLVSK